MELSPELDSFLAAMEYPATKDDLLREAARSDVSPADRDLLATLPDCGLNARWQIRRLLERAAGSAAPANLIAA